MGAGPAKHGIPKQCDTKHTYLTLIITYSSIVIHSKSNTYSFHARQGGILEKYALQIRQSLKLLLLPYNIAEK